MSQLTESIWQQTKTEIIGMKVNNGLGYVVEVSDVEHAKIIMGNRFSQQFGGSQAVQKKGSERDQNFLVFLAGFRDEVGLETISI